jgi:SrtB family sortase
MFKGRFPSLANPKKIKLKDSAEVESGRRQGFYPQQPPVEHQRDDQFVRLRLNNLSRNWGWLILLLAGVALVLVGASLMIPLIIERGNRQKAESALQTIFYQTIAPETAVLPTTSPPIVALVSPQLNAIVPPPLRSFVAGDPWKVRFTRERFLSLQRINKDVAGWLTIGSILNLPVVQRDNAYYLKRDFYGKASFSGTLFLDENYKVSPSGENLLIHGHNMRDGSMFGQLDKYTDKVFFANHWLIKFETLYEESNYAVFAALSVSNDVADPSYFRYAFNHFSTDAEFSEFIAAVRGRSHIRSDLEVLPTDRLIMLSTCKGGSDYFVVIGRRIRDDESLSSVEMTSVLSAFK